MAQTEALFIREHSLANLDLDNHIVHGIGRHLQQRFGFVSVTTFSTACTSSANAMAYGYDLIHSGTAVNQIITVRHSVGGGSTGGGKGGDGDKTESLLQVAADAVDNVVVQVEVCKAVLPDEERLGLRHAAHGGSYHQKSF